MSASARPRTTRWHLGRQEAGAAAGCLPAEEGARPREREFRARRGPFRPPPLGSPTFAPRLPASWPGNHARLHLPPSRALRPGVPGMGLLVLSPPSLVAPQTEGVRVSVNVLSEQKERPVLFVVRQKEAVVSFQVPLILRGL